MSSIGGPNMINDGLVFLFDAANSKSFRGEYTENLIANNPVPTSITSYSVQGTGTTEYIAAETCVRWRVTGYATWGAYHYNNSTQTITFDTASTYSASFEWKMGPDNEVEPQAANLIFQIVQGNGQDIVIGSPNLFNNSTLQDNGWYRFEYNNRTPNNIGINSPSFRVILGDQGTNVTDFYWRRLQLEKKPYATEFVEGTRGNTVTQGGGLFDLSRNGNNGTTTTGLTYSNTNYGTLSFDGSVDSVTIPYNSNTMDFSEAQTICMWLKPGTGADSLRRNPYNQAYGGSGTITHEPAGTINYYFGTNGGNGNPYVGRNSSFTVEPNELAFIAVTRGQTQNECNWYKNGALETELNAGGYSAVTNSTSNIIIGDGYTNNFIGDIYYVAVYNTFKTSEEISQIYDSTKSRFNFN